MIERQGHSGYLQGCFLIFEGLMQDSVLGGLYCKKNSAIGDFKQIKTIRVNVLKKILHCESKAQI